MVATSEEWGRGDGYSYSEVTGGSLMVIVSLEYLDYGGDYASLHV